MGAPSTATDGLGRGGAPLGARFLLLALASCALMVVDHREEHLTPVRQALSLALYPVRLLVDAPFSAWRWARVTLAERSALLEENASLERELLLANARLQRLDALEAENARLRELLDSTARVTDRVLVAEILAVDLDPYRQRFNVNRGEIDGAYVGQALLDANGVVGQIVEVGPLTSEAVLITDADHAVPVIVNRNGLRTIAVGTGDSGRLRLPYLTNSADIQIGDLLLSSGLGGVFPAGYPVGRVVEVHMRPGQSFAEVIAEPAAALDRDSEVLLVWTGDDDELSDPTADRSAAASLAEAAPR
ncbi:MAG TPA: rod shape-determining protein MreC [Gammaproteobacteria bacterium]